MIETDYRYFLKVWGVGGPSQGAYQYILMESRDYDSAMEELDNCHVEELDFLNPIEYLMVDKKTNRPLSQWEIKNLEKK